MKRDNTFGVSVEREIEIESSQEAIWSYLTEGSALSMWMDGEVTIEPRPGGRIILSEPDSPLVWGTVEEVIETERIQWSWRTDDGLPTLVEIELGPSAKDGTRITVRETLLPWQVSGPNANVDGSTAWRTESTLLLVA